MNVASIFPPFCVNHYVNEYLLKKKFSSSLLLKGYNMIKQFA